MSDCSSEAMKPKDMDMLKSPNVSNICDLDDAIQHIDQLLEQDELSCACRKEHEQLHSWLVELHALEQRYQQLEQIVREMFKRAYEFNREGPHLGGIYIADFREQLEALGVSVDE